MFSQQKNSSKIKRFRGYIISVLCLAYLLIYLDFDKPLNSEEIYLFYLAFFIGILGFILGFFDTVTKYKKKP